MILTPLFLGSSKKGLGQTDISESKINYMKGKNPRYGI